MKPTLEMEAKGMKAYEQACAFERLRTWRLPLTFTVFALIPALTGVLLWNLGDIGYAWLSLTVAVVFTGLGKFQWKQLVARHANNLRLLAKLKEEYGDELPWVQVENHFAALEQLKREIAEGRTPNGKTP